jgi:hypothetical protein
VWVRHDLVTRTKHLRRLEQAPGSTDFVLGEKQIRLLERYSVDFRCRHLEASRPGELRNPGLLLGHAEGVGKVHVQVSRRLLFPGVAKVYISKMPITACDLLYDPSCPSTRRWTLPIGATLTDNGREFCGQPDGHVSSRSWPYRASGTELPGYARRAINGFVEWVNRTLSTHASA